MQFAAKFLILLKLDENKNDVELSGNFPRHTSVIEKRIPMKKFFNSRLALVVLGVGLGLLARLVFGGPTGSELLPRTFLTPFKAVEVPPEQEQPIDLPLIPKEEASSETGLVPAIRVPGIEAKSGMLDHQKMLANAAKVFDSFAHDKTAFFEAHGEQLCASGCAASRHPTEELTSDYFSRLLTEYSIQPMTSESPALEELLYYGPQTRKLIELHGFSPLDSQRASFLWEELKTTHAKISIRVIDENNEIRTWLEPTLVPFDRRHVFEMETKRLQPLVTSGTVKRVGLDHMWVRL